MTTRLTRNCANIKCQMALTDPRPANHIVEEPKVNDLIICGGCGCPNILTLLGTREATDEDFSNMSVEEVADIQFAIRAAKRGIN